MKPITATAFELVDAIDDVKPIKESLGRLVQFMIASCDLITGSMPSVALRAFEVARRYWVGDATRAELESARVECWEHLDRIGSSTVTDDAQACATRAVICLLYPTIGEEDPLELAHWFIGLTQKVMDIDREQRAILETLFDDVLGQ